VSVVSAPETPCRLPALGRPAVLAHLLALDADDRYGRFASPLPDAGIVAYVDCIDFRRDFCFATLEADGRLSGFIHLAVHGTAAELGASVLPAWRRQGRARRLFATALGRAAAAGIGEVHLTTGHPAARHICADLGYAQREGVGYPRVRVILGPD
jgi:GNAT superfamily N-acetyltransferase